MCANEACSLGQQGLDITTHLQVVLWVPTWPFKKLKNSEYIYHTLINNF